MSPEKKSELPEFGTRGARSEVKACLHHFNDDKVGKARQFFIPSGTNTDNMWCLLQKEIAVKGDTIYLDLPEAENDLEVIDAIWPRTAHNLGMKFLGIKQNHDTIRVYFGSDPSVTQ